MITVIQKSIHHLRENYFYLFSPIVQAVIVYIAFVVLLWLRDFPNFKIAIWAFVIFSIASPTINLFLPHWKLSTILFIVAWVVLYLAINITFSLIYLGAIIFSIPMLAGGVFLPITALLRFFWFRSLAEVEVFNTNAK